MAEYSVREYFGSNTDAFDAYKKGKAEGKYKDLPDYLSKGGTTSGYKSGGSSLNLSSVPSSLGFAQELNKGVSESLTALTTKMAGQEKPLDIYNQLETAVGLPEQRKVAQNLRGQISNIEDTIKRVEPNIAATTKESMVTEAQRQGMATAQKKPLLETLGTFTTDLGRISDSISASMQDLSTKVGLYVQGQQMELQPLIYQYQSTIDSAARLQSAFNTDSQNQLSVLIANWTRQNTLSDQEYTKAFTLLQSENSYTQELQKAAATAGVTLTGNETNAEILAKIGSSASEQIQYDRNKTGTEGGISEELLNEIYGDSGVPSYFTPD